MVLSIALTTPPMEARPVSEQYGFDQLPAPAGEALALLGPATRNRKSRR
jgi:hypothetical protein